MDGHRERARNRHIDLLDGGSLDVLPVLELQDRHPAGHGSAIQYAGTPAVSYLLVRAGVDSHVVQRLLGHASIASTVGYTHLVLDDLRGAVAGM